MSQGRNAGFTVLGEFVCQAIPTPELNEIKPCSEGRNEGFTVLPESNANAIIRDSNIDMPRQNDNGDEPT